MSTTTPTPAQAPAAAAEGNQSTPATPAEGKSTPPASTPAASTPPEAGAGTPDATKPAAESATPPAPAAPEKYELKLEEGSKLKPEQVEEIKAYAKSKNLSQEQAQELLTRQDQAVRGFAEEQQKLVDAEIEKWGELSKNDKEIGGEAFPQHAEAAKRALDRFGNETFKKMLDETGFGNHPEVLRIFAKIGRAMSEDKMINPNAQGGPSVQSMEEKFYGSKK